MQISQLMRSLLGEQQPTEAKTLQLKVGQVVKGKVMQMLGERDAIVNIGGVHVRAKLEAPLEQGQVTYLQVQPESNGSQTVLKPIAGTAAQLTGDSLSALIRSFGLKDSPAIRQLALQLQQADIALTKDQLQRFAQVIEQAPKDVPAEQWLEAAIVANNRNLPVTRETVRGLREAMFGEPLGSRLNGLEAQAKQAAGTLPRLTGNAATEARKLLDKLEQAIRAVRESVGQVVEAGETGEAALATKAAPGTSQPANAAHAASDRGAFQETGSHPAARESEAVPAIAGKQADSEPRASSSRLEPVNGRPIDGDDSLRQTISADAKAAPHAEGPLDAENGRVGKDSDRNASASEGGHRTQPEDGAEKADPAKATKGEAPVRQQAVDSASRTAGDGNDESAVAGDRTKPDASAGSAAQRTAVSGQEEARSGTPNKEGDHWISRLFQAVGIDHERHVSRAVAQTELRSANAAGLPSPDIAPGGQLAAAADVVRSAADNLKSVLLQLAGSDAMPDTLREGAQQTLQHITGQQLLLAPDRGAVLTHVTLLLPMRHEGGEQTAAVHVQSRKGKRGELDAHNCRLLFDLNMQTLGLTLVDVQVFDRKVHVQVHNDTPFLGKLLEQYRSEIEEGLRQTGYECAALKSAPYPQPVSPEGGAAGDEPLSPAPTAAAEAYRVKPYKGVDVRI